MDNQTARRSVTGGIGGKLTDKAVKAFVGKAAPGKKLADGGGLHLFITPAGGATWRVKFRIEGKEKLYSVGPYESARVSRRLIGVSQAVTADRSSC
ncbi:MAG: Arm DNA-binding domain-containing protein [Burkholderiales bacterium]|nr:Arm DNA-binding domain-containing protein [Burkholderiales bacterium]